MKSLNWLFYILHIARSIVEGVWSFSTESIPVRASNPPLLAISSNLVLIVYGESLSCPSEKEFLLNVL